MRKITMIICVLMGACILLGAKYKDMDESQLSRSKYSVEDILKHSAVITGVHWNRISRNEKLSYLMGYRNALTIADLVYGSNKCTGGLYSGNTVPSGELLSALDEFYQDPVNISATVPQALYRIKQNQQEGE